MSCRSDATGEADCPDKGWYCSPAGPLLRTARSRPRMVVESAQSVHSAYSSGL